MTTTQPGNRLSQNFRQKGSTVDISNLIDEWNSSPGYKPTSKNHEKGRVECDWRISFWFDSMNRKFTQYALLTKSTPLHMKRDWMVGLPNNFTSACRQAGKGWFIVGGLANCCCRIWSIQECSNPFHVLFYSEVKVFRTWMHQFYCFW